MYSKTIANSVLMHIVPGTKVDHPLYGRGVVEKYNPGNRSSVKFPQLGYRMFVLKPEHIVIDND